jgi:NarL family two-component system response regulator LiaR
MPAGRVREEPVRAHVSSILAKLGLADRTQAAIFGLQQRLGEISETHKRWSAYMGK